MARFEKRIRKAFCKGCPMYARGEPKDCLAYFEGISEDEICHIIWEPERFARGARRFVKMEEADRLKRQQRIDAEIKREEELLKTMNPTCVLVGYPIQVIWGAHGKRYHELGGQLPWPVAACGVGFDMPSWGTPEEARAKGLTPCKDICGKVFRGVDEGRYPAGKEQGDDN